ncbi:hypothetical protein K1D88_23860, partial [Escherichia coli]|uniref:hypothetical protein n=1 Tax=Escherichia coli TaxID=562 RepID=UPI001C68C920
GPDPRNFNQRVSLGRNDLLIRTFPKVLKRCILPAPDGGVEKLSKPNLHGVIKKVDLNTNEAEIKIKEGGQ